MKPKALLPLILIAALVSSSVGAAEKSPFVLSTETPCPRMYGAMGLEASEAKLPAVYDGPEFNFYKGLLPQDVEETKAIVRETVDQVPIFFGPYSLVYRKGNSQSGPLQELMRAIPKKGFEKLTSEQRKDLLRKYVNSVLETVDSDPTKLLTTSLSGGGMMASPSAIEAAQARILKLKADPRQRELLVGALDAELPYAVKVNHWSKPGNSGCERELPIFKLFMGGVVASIFLPHLGLSDVTDCALVGLSIGGVLASTFWRTYAIAAEDPHTVMTGAAKRALARYLAAETNKSKTAVAWQQWRVAGQALDLDEKGGASLTDSVMTQGYRLMNTSKFLSSVSIEELPTGERFKKFFRTGVKIPEQEVNDLKTAVNARLNQLQVVKAELARTQAQIAENSARFEKEVPGEVEPEAVSALAQVTKVQARGAAQMAVSIEVATGHLKAIQNLVAIGIEGQGKIDQLTAELQKLNESIKPVEAE